MRNLTRVCFWRFFIKPQFFISQLNEFSQPVMWCAHENVMCIRECDVTTRMWCAHFTSIDKEYDVRILVCTSHYVMWAHTSSNCAHTRTCEITSHCAHIVRAMWCEHENVMWARESDVSDSATAFWYFYHDFFSFLWMCHALSMFTLTDHAHTVANSGKAPNYPVGLLTIKSRLLSIL